MSGEQVDEIVVDAARSTIYAEGWQSWSPTRMYAAEEPAPRPEAAWEEAMRFRPGAATATGDWRGEGLLVIDPGTGEPVCTYALTGDGRCAVPTIRATRVADDRLVVEADGPVTMASDDSVEAALERFGDELAARAGLVGVRPAPTAWCSWYQFFERVAAADVTEVLGDLDRLDLPVDVVQIDDGWSTGLGDGLLPRGDFGPLDGIVDTIRSTGRRAGIWLAPFLVGARTRLAVEHPDWLTSYAGFNWGQDLVGLDLTHPGVRDLLADHVSRLVGLGVDYLKLDFLYGGAMPGGRRDGSDAVTAYRSGLELIREVAGPDTYLVGCGAPILPSVGVVDAMRVSPDTFHEGGEDGSRGLRGRPGIAARAWQQGRLWANDPDCLVARPAYSLREPWAAVVEEFGGLRSCSDQLSQLDDWGLATTRRLLTAAPVAGPLPRSVVRRGLELSRDPVSTGPLEEGRP